MTLNLDALKDEILDYLQTEGFVVFRGYSRIMDEGPYVYWDTDGHPDYRQFVETARQVGVKLIVYNWRTFTTDMVDSAIERLEESDLSREDRRSLERRLRALRDYDGFTCGVELSFDYQGRTYLFNLNADWYEDYLDLLDEIDAAMSEEDEEDEDSMGGYFSRN